MFLKNVIYHTVVLKNLFIIRMFISFIVTVVLMRLGEIPVPIPNTAVKSEPVDDT